MNTTRYIFFILIFLLFAATPLHAQTANETEARLEPAPQNETAPPPSLERMRLEAVKGHDPKRAPIEKPAALEKPKRDRRQPHWAEGLVVNTLRGKAQEQQRTNPDRDLRPTTLPPDSPGSEPKIP